MTTCTTQNRWAILIGINDYHESLGTLKYSVNDCRRLAEVLTTGDDAFPTDQVLVLADDEVDDRKPSYANIHSWLASWLAQADDDDTVLVFFAGHGREIGGKCYLVPGDATLQTIHVTGIPVSYVQDLLNRCKARQKLLILDACHSGAGRDVSTMAAPMMETLSAGKGIYTLTSCDLDEVSHDWDEKQQGVFSYYFAEALSGSCPSDDRGRITLEAIYEWTFERVRRWAARHRCSQNPYRLSQGAGTLVLFSTRRRANPRPNEEPEDFDASSTEAKAEPAHEKPVDSTAPRDYGKSNQSKSFKRGSKQMAMVKCSKCGNDVSATASKCPRCGAPPDNLGAATAGLETLVTLGRIIQTDDGEPEKANG